MKSCFFMKLSSHRKFITNRQTSPCPSVYIETILFCLYHFAYRIYTELNILHCKTLGVVTETQFAENLLIFQPCTSTSTLTCSKLASYLKTNKGKRKKKHYISLYYPSIILGSISLLYPSIILGSMKQAYFFKSCRLK